MARLVVIGAGVAGLAAAHAALEREPALDVVVLERSARTGGLVETTRTTSGLVVEHGPDSLVTAKPAGLAAAKEIGLADDILGTGPAPRRAFVVVRGAMQSMPDGMTGFAPRSVAQVLRSPLFSLKGKMRLTMEPWIRAQRDQNADESVGAFFSRRFGVEMRDYFVDPVLRGVYGASAQELSMRCILPRLMDLEAKHGSVAKGIAIAKSPPSPTIPPIVTLRAGMESLTDAYSNKLRGRLKFNVRARRITRTRNQTYRIELGGDGALEAENVILATPAWTSADLLAELSPDAADVLGNIRGTSLGIVTFAFKKTDIPHELHGTGFVVAAGEALNLTACTWSSRKWNHRAPDGAELLRCFVNPQITAFRDMIEAARSDLQALLGTTAAPVFTDVTRREQALPVYTVGHLDRNARLQACVSAFRGLALAGNAYRGLGLPDCIESGRDAAARVLA